MRLTTYTSGLEKQLFWKNETAGERIVRDGTKFIKEYPNKDALYRDMDFHKKHSRKPLIVIGERRIYFVPLILAQGELAMAVYLTGDAQPLAQDNSSEAADLKELLKEKEMTQVIPDLVSMQDEKGNKIFVVLSVAQAEVLLKL